MDTLIFEPPINRKTRITLDNVLRALDNLELSYEMNDIRTEKSGIIHVPMKGLITAAILKTLKDSTEGVNIRLEHS